MLPVGLYLPVPHSAQSLCRCPGLECESPTDRLTARAVRTAHHGTSGPRCARTPRTALPNTLPPGRRWEGGGQSEAPLGVIADRGVGRRARLGGAADGRSGTRRYSRARGLLERRDRDVSIRAGRSVDGLPLGSGPSVLRVRLHARRMLSGMPFGLTTPGGQPVGSYLVPIAAPGVIGAHSVGHVVRWPCCSRQATTLGPAILGMRDLALLWACRGVGFRTWVRSAVDLAATQSPFRPSRQHGKTCVDPRASRA